MALFEKKQQLGQSGKPEKMPAKEEKKGTSGLGGNPFITREQGKHWAWKEGFQKTGLQPEEVAKHWDEVTKDAPSGYVTKSWAEQKLRKLQQQSSSMTISTDWLKRRDVDGEIKVLKGFLEEK